MKHSAKLVSRQEHASKFSFVSHPSRAKSCVGMFGVKTAGYTEAYLAVGPNSDRYVQFWHELSTEDPLAVCTAFRRTIIKHDLDNRIKDPDVEWFTLFSPHGYRLGQNGSNPSVFIQVDGSDWNPGVDHFGLLWREENGHLRNYHGDYLCIGDTLHLEER